MKKINSIGYGYKIISIGILFGFIFPFLIFLIPYKSSILYILSKISLFTGITILILFFIWLKIELNQDRRINEHYEKHKNEKLLIGKEKYECQACGNRQVKLNDERCNICGIKFVDTGNRTYNGIY